MSNNELTHTEITTLERLAERAMLRPSAAQKLEDYKNELRAHGVSDESLTAALSGKMF